MRGRPQLALIAAAAIAAAVGRLTYRRIEELAPADAVLARVSEGFWILALVLGGLGVAGLVAPYLVRVLGRAPRVHDVSQLGQYTLVEKLGEGAMGAVYRARHALLRRPTAIKLMHAERQNDARAMRRFEREVQQTSRLMHPNTVAVFDYGHAADGVFYYAMELIEGVTLEALVRELGPLPPARVMYILDQVCGSLTEAHEIGLIHRDIKPANIMVCEQGGEHDVAKVLDFGLVKDMEEASVSLTVGDALAGTPLYASPEAIRGSHEVVPASDLYSLGAVGYFLLTGLRVFDGETVMEVCTQHLTHEPVPPSLRVDGLELPADLEQVIMRCLAKTPDERPASARELRRELHACADYGAWSETEAASWWNQERERLPLPGRGLARQLDEAGLTLTIDLSHRGS